MPRPTVICLTPVKNEAWILERFLACASIWADHVIVADQGSDDGSREIALRFPKVTLIENPNPSFNEPERQRLLIDAARRVPGPRLLVALDADEFLTANHLCSPEWKAVLEAPEGTVIRFPWPTILPERRYYMYPDPLPFGFMDDGSPHEGRKIHSPRVPVPEGAPELILDEVKVMHFVGVDPLRWRSKIRWYQCWEWLNNRTRRAAQFYRFYHKDLFVPENAISAVPRDWLEGYEERGIDLTNIAGEDVYRWDRELLALLDRHGPETFRQLAIWDMDWAQLSRRVNGGGAAGNGGSGDAIRDPRSRLDRAVHWWLQRTQPYYSHHGRPRSRAVRISLRWVDRVLAGLGW